MRNLIERFDSIHKMHHFLLILVIAPVLMWFLSGVAGSFRIPGSGGQLAMLIAWALGQAIFAIVAGALVLLFAKPSTAWGVVAAVAILIAYTMHRSEVRADQGADVAATGRVQHPQ